MQVGGVGGQGERSWQHSSPNTDTARRHLMIKIVCFPSNHTEFSFSGDEGTFANPVGDHEVQA